MDNKGWLVILVVVLIGVLAFVLMRSNGEISTDTVGENIDKAIDKADKGIEDVRKKVKDEIDGNKDESR